MSESIPTLETFLVDARLAGRAHDPRRHHDDQKLVWGHGEFSVAVFHALSGR